MLRVPVLSKSGKPLMPTKASRARRWLEEGKAKVVHNDLECFAVQLTVSSREDLQPVAVGLDPGKLYSGIGVQSSRATLWMAHLILPFKTVKDRMELRRIMRRARRGRRINRKIPYNKRCHRQVRFNNRKQAKLPPSIRANKQLEFRVIKELFKLFPISSIHYELVMADVDKTSGRRSARSGVGFSPVMVGQRQMLNWLSELAPVKTVCFRLLLETNWTVYCKKSSVVAAKHRINRCAFNWTGQTLPHRTVRFDLEFLSKLLR